MSEKLVQFNEENIKGQLKKRISPRKRGRYAERAVGAAGREADPRGSL